MTKKEKGMLRNLMRRSNKWLDLNTISSIFLR